MVNAKFLEGLYPLYLRIRLHCPNNSSLQWIHFIIRYIQFSVIPLYIQPLNDNFKKNEYSDPFAYIQQIAYFNTWIFSTESNLYINTLIFLSLIIFNIYFYVTAKSAKNGRYITHGTCSFIRFFQQHLTEVIALPLYYRFAYAIKIIDTNHELCYTLGLVFATLNVLLNFINIYLSSVFLDSVDFKYTCKAELFDGKYQMPFAFCHFIDFLIFSFYLRWKTDIIPFVMISLLVLIALFVFYLRVLNHASVSYIGSFFETVPFISMPIMLIPDSLNAGFGWIPNISIFILVNLLYGIFLYYFARHTISKSNKVFAVLLKKSAESTQENMDIPTVISGNNVTVMRSIVISRSDPTIFERFLIMQKRFGYRTSHIIEIVRFLALFPSKRESLLALITEQTSNSTYNRWILFYFKQSLKLLITKSKEREYNTIRSMFDLHSIIYQQFWVARRNKKFFSAFMKAGQISTIYKELKLELLDNIRLCPLDPQIFSFYSHFLLLMNADYGGYIRNQTITREMLNGKYQLLDPILYPMSAIYPKVLQFCEESELKMSRSSSVAMSETSMLMTSGTDVSLSLSEARNLPLRGGPPPETLVRNLVESRLTSYNYLSPWYIIFLVILPCIAITSFFSVIYPIYQGNWKHGNIIFSEINKTVQTLYQYVASTYLPHIRDEPTGNLNTSIELDCQFILSQFPNTVINYFAAIPQVQELGKLVLPLTFHIFREQITEQLPACKFLRNFNETLLKNSNVQYTFLLKYQNSTVNELYSFHKHITRYYDNKVYFHLFIVSMLTFLLLYFIASVLTINLIKPLRKDIMDYLGSDERRRYIMKGEYLLAIRSMAPYLSIDTENINSNMITRSRSSDRLEILNNSDDINFGKPKYIKSPSFDLAVVSRRNRQIQGKRLSRSLDPASSEQFTLESELNNSTDNEIDERAQELIKDSKNIFCIAALRSLAIWIYVFILLVLSSIVLKERSNREDAMMRHILEQVPVVMDSISIVKLMHDKLNGMNIDSEIRELYKHLDETKFAELRDMFNHEMCYSLMTITCTSAKKLYMDLMSLTVYDDGIILGTFLPIFLTFERSMLYHIKSKVDEVINLPSSPFASFISVIVLLALLFIYFGIKAGTLIKPAIGSLFHVPDRNKKEEPTVTEADRRAPAGVLVISAIESTGEIYSISDNATKFLGRPPVDFVCRSIDETFPTVSGAPEHREYTMPDHRTKKIFRVDSVRCGSVTKLLMVEEPKDAIQSREAIAQKLSTAIPPFFAKVFADEGKIDIDNGVSSITMVRVDTGNEVGVLDRFFNAANLLCQNYGTVRLFRADGAFLMYVSKLSAGLSPLMFARDLLSDTAKKLRSDFESKTFPISCICIRYAGDVSLRLVESVEPFLDVACEGFQSLVESALGAERGRVYVSEEVLKSARREGFGDRIETPLGVVFSESFHGFVQFLSA